MDTLLHSICQGRLCRTGPLPLALQSLSILISVWVHRIARLGWLFNDFTRTRDRAVHVPTVTSLFKPWKADCFFFPNWHRLCLGQEPNINYKDWPQPREHEKKLDNTVGKLFSHVNWHSKYVLVLYTFSMPMEPSVMEKNVLALVSQGTWTDWNISIRQSNFN